MPALPTDHGSVDTWGAELIAYLGVAHNADGTLKSSGAATTLVSSTSVGATTASVASLPAGLQIGAYVAIGAGTSTCEVRRVTDVVGTTLTVGALNLAHSVAENIWILNSTWVTPEWFGCRGADVSFDNAAGLQQMFNDLAAGASFGITGHANRYHTSTPLAIYDNTRLEHIAFTAKLPFSIDPKLGLNDGLPDQYFATLAGQTGTISSVNTATDTITLSTNAGAAVGDVLIFYPRPGATLPAPLEAGRGYYIKTFSGNDYTVSVDRAGATLDITSAGTGLTVFYSTGVSRMQWDTVTFEGSNLQALNGLRAMVQQPSNARNLRCDEFPGLMGCAVIGGQEGTFDGSPMFTNGHIGLRLRGAQFIYIQDVNFEDCDILMQIDGVDINGTAAGTTDIGIINSHWETPGIHTSMCQTLMGNAAVSAGTFTLSFGGQTTTGIAHNANAATIQTALEALSTIDPGDITVADEAGGLPSGRVRVTFAGQYVGKTMSGTNKMTVISTGLTGGSYSMNYVYPDAKCVSVGAAVAGVGIHGGRVSAGGTRPDGTSPDFFVVESAATTFAGYVLERITSVDGAGNAVKDIPRGVTKAWADADAAERLNYFSAGGYHGGTAAKNWVLAGRSGQTVEWSEYNGEFRFNGAARVRFGDTGPLVLSGSGSPEGVITAPIGSLYLRIDGGTNTSLYRKESGAGNTGWVASTNPSGSAGGYPRIFNTGSYYCAPSSSFTNETTYAMPLNQVHYVPFAVGEAVTVDRILASVTTAGSAGAVVRLGIYADTDGKPAALLLDAGTIDSTTTGYKEIVISQALSSGALYWVAVVAQVAACTLRAPASGNGSEWVGGSQTADARICNFIQTGVAGALPNPAVPAVGTTQNPLAKLRAA
jgi:hypothetical protein